MEAHAFEAEDLPREKRRAQNRFPFAAAEADFAPRFTPLSIAHPAITSTHAAVTSSDGIRRERSATVSGTKTHVNCVKNADVLAAM